MSLRLTLYKSSTLVRLLGETYGGGGGCVVGVVVVVGAGGSGFVFTTSCCFLSKGLVNVNADVLLGVDGWAPPAMDGLGEEVVGDALLNKRCQQRTKRIGKTR